jgi:hypothetical protein
MGMPPIDISIYDGVICSCVAGFFRSVGIGVLLLPFFNNLETPYKFPNVNKEEFSCNTFNVDYDFPRHLIWS